MQSVSKNKIANWLLLDLIYQKQNCQDKINQFEKKHNLKLQDFEIKLENSNIENFENWDDLIEWKANNSVLVETSFKINEINNELFQMV